MSFHMGNLGKYKGHIFRYWRGYFKVLVILSDFINISHKASSIFHFQRPRFGYWTGIELYASRWENLEPWNYSRMSFPFPNIVAVILTFWFFFSDSINIFRRLLVFSSFRDQILAAWLVSGCVTLFGAFLNLGIYRMKVSFHIISTIALMLW